MKIDMSDTIIAKSDQLNSDDLISGAITIKIRDIAKAAGDQPVSIFFDGDNGKPFKPCKSMRKVMVNVWGKYAENYVGRSMTLYRDPKVKWGGAEVGGIRISHMSDINAPVTMALTETKASRKPFTVKPLEVAQEATDKAAIGCAALIARIADAAPGELAEILAEDAVKKQAAYLEAKRPELYAELQAAIAAATPV